MLKTLPLIALLIALSGCATLDHGETQKITVNTLNNSDLDRTKCTVDNEEGQWVILPNYASIIHRDDEPMTIICRNPAQQGKTVVTYDNFHSNLLMADIFYDLCIISCWVDAYKNAFYSYQDSIDVTMIANKKPN